MVPQSSAEVTCRDDESIKDTKSIRELSARWLGLHRRLIRLINEKLVNRADRFVLRLRGGRRYTTSPEETPDLADLHKYCGVSVFDVSVDGTCKFIGFDIDDHSAAGADTLGESLRVVDWLEVHGFRPLLVRSSENSFHIWVKFAEPIPHLQAYRLVSHVRDCLKRDIEIEIRPERLPKPNYNLGSSLRLPGFLPGKSGNPHRYSGFTDNKGESWEHTPEQFIKWLETDGDSPGDLVPEIIGTMSTGEREEAAREKQRAERQHERTVRNAFFRSQPNVPFDGNIWSKARNRFNESVSWDEVLEGNLVSVGPDAWARNADDKQCASTKTGLLWIFGTSTAAAMGLEPKKGYRKWQVYEKIHNPSRDTKVAIQLLKQCGCWPDGSETNSFSSGTFADDADDKQFLQRKSQKKELRVPLSEPPLKPELSVPEIDYSVPVQRYRENIVQIVSERLQLGNREPLIVVNELNSVHVLIDILRRTTLNLLIVTRTIEAAHKLTDQLQEVFNQEGTADPKVDLWDSRRTQESKSGLPKNCDNDISDVAAGMGFSASAAVCKTCSQNINCALMAHRKLAIQAHHLIVPQFTLLQAGVDAFGERSGILAIDVDPDELLRLTASTDQLDFVLGRLEEALDKLADHPTSQSGYKSNKSRAVRYENWRLSFKKLIKDLRQESKVPSRFFVPTQFDDPPGNAVAKLFNAMEHWERETNDERNVGAVLRAAKRGASVFVHGDSLSVVIEHPPHLLPVISLITEPKNEDPAARMSVNKAYETIWPDKPSDLKLKPRVSQHVFPLSQLDKPERFHRVLGAVMNDHLATKVTVVTHPEFLQSVQSLKDERISRVLSFHQAAVSTFEDVDLVVCLGAPHVHDTEVSQKTTSRPEVQIIGLETKDGASVDVQLRTYRDPALMQEQGRLIRRKLGNVVRLDGPKVVIVTDRYTGFPLAATSLIPETMTTSAVRRVLNEAFTPLSAKSIMEQSNSPGGITYSLRLLRDSVDYLSLQIGPFATNMTLDKYKEHTIRSSLVQLARFVNLGKAPFSRAEYEQKAGVANTTAKRELRKLCRAKVLEVSGKGRATKYTLTETGRCLMESEPKPIEFLTQHGELVEAVPPTDWDGQSVLYARSELVNRFNPFTQDYS